MNLAAVRTSIQSLAHVHDVHDLHATQIATGVPVLTAHVVVDDSCFHDGHLMQMLDQVQAELRESFAIEHTTIQFEAVTHSVHEYATHD